MTFSVISPPDCALCVEDPEPQVHNQVQALCLRRSVPNQYRFKPVGVIVVQLTERGESMSERGSSGTDGRGSFALESQLCCN